MTKKLFQPLRLGDLNLPNRIVMAPMTRSRADDDGVLTATRTGRKIYRVYTVGDKQVPKLHDVTIGIANTRFTELISGDLKAGDDVITRTVEPPVKK